MTREEKARSLCCSGCSDYNCYTKGGSCVQLKNLMRMAEWKDEQYNEEKRDLLGLVKMLKIDEQNQTIIEDLVAILDL